MAFLGGEDARRPGWAVKRGLREFIQGELPGYGYRGNVNVVLVQQIEGEDGDEVAGDEPLISIRTVERDRQSWSDSNSGLEGTLHKFHLEARVVTRSESTSDDEPPVGEALSDDLDDLLTRDGADASLDALGIQNITVGRRTEQTSKGTFINRHRIECLAVALKQ